MPLTDHTLVKASPQIPTHESPASPCVEKGRPRLAPWIGAYQKCSDLCVWSWRTVRVPWWAQTTQGGVTTGSQGTHHRLISNTVVVANQPRCHTSPNKVLQQSWDPSHKLLMLYSRLLVIRAIIAHKAVIVSQRVTPIREEMMKSQTRKENIFEPHQEDGTERNVWTSWKNCILAEPALATH